jgi:hypothetical protein
VRIQRGDVRQPRASSFVVPRRRDGEEREEDEDEREARGAAFAPRGPVPVSVVMMPLGHDDDECLIV